MANPNFPNDGQGERIDALVNAAGTVFMKYGVGSVTVTGGTQAAAWHGAATHADAATAGATDGVSVAAGMSGTTVKHALVDSNGNLQAVSALWTDGAGTYVVARTPNIFKTLSATASGDTAVWTPTSGKKFRLMRFSITLSATASQTTGGDWTIKFRDATTDIGFALVLYVPTTAVVTQQGGFTTGWVDLGNGKLSAATNNVLNINLSTALATGHASVNVAGVEE